MDVGHRGQNNRGYISIHKFLAENDNEIMDALPGFHVLTGCDVTASFNNKGKYKPFSFMEKNEKKSLKQLVILEMSINFKIQP